MVENGQQGTDRILGELGTFVFEEIAHACAT